VHNTIGQLRVYSWFVRQGPHLGLDLIYAEYEHFDIMSFTETWLKGDNSDDSIELLNFQKPFRRDRGPEKNGASYFYIIYI
jgi:hypothetical protein